MSRQITTEKSTNHKITINSPESVGEKFILGQIISKERENMERPKETSNIRPLNMDLEKQTADITQLIAVVPEQKVYAIEEHESEEKFEDNYLIINKIGKGSYSHVYAIMNKQNGITYALKRFLDKADGIYEISILNQLHTHPNIINYEEYYIYRKSIFLIFEYFPRTMRRYIDTFDECQLKIPYKVIQNYMKQLLSALWHCHSHHILHNDLKPDNIMLDYTGNLKLIDFGVSVSLDEVQNYKSSCVSYWYRSPEAFSQVIPIPYTYGVDMWSAGCIFAEMLICRPLFIAKEAQMLNKIMSTHKTLANLQTPLGIQLTPMEIDLLQKLLHLDPHQRLTAIEALNHPYFI